jgi:hypothetical protein
VLCIPVGHTAAHTAVTICIGSCEYSDRVAGARLLACMLVSAYGPVPIGPTQAESMTFEIAEQGRITPVG